MATNLKLWGSRSSEPINLDLLSLNSSLDVDRRLFREDIEGSQAYARSLFEVNLLTKDELEKIISGLDDVHRDWEEARIQFLDSDEDVHTVNERLLTEKIGPVGGKLHTGRSRNDQVVTDLKLWMKKAIKEVQGLAVKVLAELVSKAEQHIEVLMPGYTHLQRAQPVRFSHWILSYGFFLKADIDRLQNTFEMADFMPLGSGALSGNPFGIDREKLAENLGFKNVTQNSMNAVSDRDFVAQFEFDLALLSVHLSRLAEDMILYSSKEFGFLSLSEDFTTGSSLMPQKRNPDSLELVRGQTGLLIGTLTGFLTTMKGLPMTYNKDLQFDKKGLFEVFDQIKVGLEVTFGVIKKLKIDAERCIMALSYDMLITDMAYYLVRKGVPFREAHHVASEVVSCANEQKIGVNQVSLEELKRISASFDQNVAEIWNFEQSVEQYSVVGGTAKSSIEEQINILKKYISLTFPEALVNE